MKNTVRDFWKMIVDYKVSAVVMLCGIEDNEKVSSINLVKIFWNIHFQCFNILCMCIIVIIVLDNNYLN